MVKIQPPENRQVLVHDSICQGNPKFGLLDLHPFHRQKQHNNKKTTDQHFGVVLLVAAPISPGGCPSSLVPKTPRQERVAASRSIRDALAEAREPRAHRAWCQGVGAKGLVGATIGCKMGAKGLVQNGVEARAGSKRMPAPEKKAGG